MKSIRITTITTSTSSSSSSRSRLPRATTAPGGGGGGGGGGTSSSPLRRRIIWDQNGEEKEDEKRNRKEKEVTTQLHTNQSMKNGSEEYKEEEQWWLEERALTPALMGDKPPVHFNAAGSSFMNTATAEAITEYQNYELVNGGYETLAKALRDDADGALSLVRDVKQHLAHLINCDSTEVGLASSATEAWTQVFHGTQWAAVVTSLADYGTNMMSYLAAKEKFGTKVYVIENDDSGSMSILKLESALKEATASAAAGSGAEKAKPVVCALSHIATCQGCVHPVKEIGDVCEKYGVPLLVDACQSVGQLPIDMKGQKIAALTSTSRKYCRGPRGVGFLAVRASWMDTFAPAYVDVFGAQLRSKSAPSGGGDPTDAYENVMTKDASRYEQYERNYAAVAGFGAAIVHILNVGQDRIWSRISSLANRLRGLLTSIETVTVHDTGIVQCGIVSFSSTAANAADIKNFLAKHRVFVHTSRRSSSIAFFEHYNLPDAVCRASVHYYNTEEELSQLAGLVSDYISHSSHDDA